MAKPDQLDVMIWQWVDTIPAGKVATYGQIATLCGYPNHARYVGLVLRKLPAYSKLPWHRVINAHGCISLPQGNEGHREQKRRLEREGVTFTNGRIDLAKYQWRC